MAERILTEADLNPMEMAMASLGTRLSSVENKGNSLSGRIDALEQSGAVNALSGRVTALEQRIVPKTANIPNVTANAASAVSITVAGISVASVGAMNEVKALALECKDRINKMLAMSVQQKFMEPA